MATEAKQRIRASPVLRGNLGAKSGIAGRAGASRAPIIDLDLRP